MADPGIIQRRIGDIELEVTVEERHEDTLTITEHPVQDGAAISDHAYKDPMQVTITAGQSGKENDDDPREVYERLLELQESREPFEIITGKREYENMLIQSLTVINDADTSNVLMVIAECREVKIVETETTQVPASRQGQAQKTQSTQNSGAKQAQDNQADSANTGEEAKKQSFLNSLLG